MKTLKTLIVLGTVVLLGGVGFLYSGLYNMGADNHHYKPVYWALETLRERAIAARASKLDVPALDDPNMLLAGGADYNEMCSGCHMKPGKKQSEISVGLYPQPPNLSLSAMAHGHGDADGDAHGDAKASAARQFWIIKHGVKASGMAAFGATHDDARIWAMVAFLQKLPTLNAMQYKILTARGDDDMSGMQGLDHDDVDAPAASHDEHDEDKVPTKTDSHTGMNMPGMSKQPANAPDSSTPQAGVEAFQAALKFGDAKAAQLWLASDVVIYEGGGAQHSRTEYIDHHLAGDIAFMRNARIDILKRSAGGDNKTACVITESRIRGKTSKGNPLDVTSTETALLHKASDAG